jgi:hypothetical protein
VAGRREDQGGGAVVDLAGVAGGDRAVLLEGGFERADAREVGLERLLVPVDDPRLPLLLGDRDRHDLLGEEPRLGRLPGAPVALDREGVLLLAAELEFAGAELGAAPHVEVIVGIPQAVVDHRIDELAVPEAEAVAHACGQVGGLAHALHPPGHHQLEVAAAEVVGGDHHRPHAGAADLVQGEGAGRDGAAGREGGLAGRGLPLPGWQDAPHVDLLDVLRREAGPLDGRRDRPAPEGMGRELGKHTLEGSHRSAHRAQDNDVFHNVSVLCLSLLCRAANDEDGLAFRVGRMEGEIVP